MEFNILFMLTVKIVDSERFPSIILVLLLLYPGVHLSAGQLLSSDTH